MYDGHLYSFPSFNLYLATGEEHLVIDYVLQNTFVIRGDLRSVI